MINATPPPAHVEKLCPSPLYYQLSASHKTITILRSQCGKKLIKIASIPAKYCEDVLGDCPFSEAELQPLPVKHRRKVSKL